MSKFNHRVKRLEKILSVGQPKNWIAASEEEIQEIKTRPEYSDGDKIIVLDPSFVPMPGCEPPTEGYYFDLDESLDKEGDRSRLQGYMEKNPKDMTDKELDLAIERMKNETEA